MYFFESADKKAVGMLPPLNLMEISD